MTGVKGAHGGSRFIRHLQMKHALGLPYSYKMWPTKQMRGRDRRRGTWWNRKQKCVAIEGVDFAQDTQEGGADEFELLPDSDEEGAAKGSSLLGDDDEYVPETEPQAVPVSTIIGPCANKGRQHLGNLLHEWRRVISDVENESGKVDIESAKVQMDSFKLEKESAKVEMESDKLDMCAIERMDSVIFDKEYAKVEMDNVKFEESAKVSTIMLSEWHRIISDMENQSGKVDMESAKVQMDSAKLEESAMVEMESHKFEMCAKVQMDSVILEKESDKMEMDTVKLEKESAKVQMDSTKVCSIMLREWYRILSDMENQCGKVEMESAKVQMDSVKLEKESVKVEMESDKLDMCGKVQMDNVKLEMSSMKMDTGKEELDHTTSFSDIETNDEACWVQDGVDLRGHSQVEDDDFNEQGLLIVFVIRIGRLLFIKYDVNSICVHTKIVYDIVQDYLPMGHLNQMHG